MVCTHQSSWTPAKRGPQASGSGSLYKFNTYVRRSCFHWLPASACPSTLYCTILCTTDTTEKSLMDRSLMFPLDVLIKLFANSYHLCFDCTEFRIQDHFCSLAKPCALASQLFQTVYVLRQVSSGWNKAFIEFQSSKEYRFLRRVEDAYYPHPWHINSKVRSSILFYRYRVFNTIDTEDGKLDRIFHRYSCAEFD